MNTTTQRRNKQARVATVSAPTIAEPRTDTPSTPPDIQPCANEGLHRTIPGSSQTGRRAGEPLWGEGKARAVRALADEQGLGPRAVVRLQQWRRGRAVPRDGRQPVTWVFAGGCT